MVFKRSIEKLKKHLRKRLLFFRSFFWRSKKNEQEASSKRTENKILRTLIKEKHLKKKQKHTPTPSQEGNLFNTQRGIPKLIEDLRI